jgi:hypothetical protein
MSASVYESSSHALRTETEVVSGFILEPQHLSMPHAEENQPLQIQW